MIQQKEVFCTTCGKKVVADVERVRLPNWTYAYKGTCPVCKHTVIRGTEE